MADGTAHAREISDWIARAKADERQRIMDEVVGPLVEALREINTAALYQINMDRPKTMDCEWLSRLADAALAKAREQMEER